MMTVRLFILACLSISFFCWLLACCGGEKSLRVTQLLIDRVLMDDDFVLSRADIREVCKKILSNQKNINIDLSGSKKGVLRVRLQVLEDTLLSQSQLLINLKYTQMTGRGLQQYFGSGSALILKKENSLLDFKDAFREALLDLLASWRGESQSIARLLKIIKQSRNDKTISESQLLQAIHVLGVKKEKKAVGALIQILLSREEKAAFASLAALTNIADSTALDAIIRYSERKNSNVRKQAILAARQMGGVKAAAWLFTLSTGHEDPEVRLVASEALKFVEARLKAN